MSLELSQVSLIISRGELPTAKRTSVRALCLPYLQRVRCAAKKLEEMEVPASVSSKV